MPKFYSKYIDEDSPILSSSGPDSSGPDASKDYTQGGKDIYTQAAEQLLNQSRNKNNFDDFKDTYAYDIATQLVRHNQDNQSLGEDEQKNLIDAEYNKIINRAKDYVPSANWENTRTGKQIRGDFGSVTENVNPLNALDKFNTAIGGLLKEPADALVAGGAGIANMFQGRDAWDESQDVKNWREGIQKNITPETLSVVPSLLEDAGITAATGGAALPALIIKNAWEASPQILEGLSNKDTVTGVNKDFGESALQTGAGLLPVALSALPAVGKFGKLAGKVGKAAEGEGALSKALTDAARVEDAHAIEEANKLVNSISPGPSVFEADEAVNANMKNKAPKTIGQKTKESLQENLSKAKEELPNKQYDIGKPNEGKAFSEEDFKDIGQDIKNRVNAFKDNGIVSFLRGASPKGDWFDEAVEEAEKVVPSRKLNMPEIGDVKEWDKYVEALPDEQANKILDAANLSDKEKDTLLETAFKNNPDLRAAVEAAQPAEASTNAALEEELFPNKKKKGLSNLAKRFSPSERNNINDTGNLKQAIESLDRLATGENITGEDITLLDNLLKTVQAQGEASPEKIQKFANLIANGNTDVIKPVSNVIKSNLGFAEGAEKGAAKAAANAFNTIARGGEIYEGLIPKGIGAKAAKAITAPVKVGGTLLAANALANQQPGSDVPPGLFPAMALSLALRKPSSRLMSSAIARKASPFTNFGKMSASKGSLYNTFNLGAMVDAINKQNKWRTTKDDKGPDAGKNLRDWMRTTGDFYSKGSGKTKGRQ